ncbi:phosphoglycerate kinase, partial [Penicillium bovifimosum]
SSSPVEWAFTFKKTLENAFKIGNSPLTRPAAKSSARSSRKAKKNNVQIVLPVDYVTADKFSADATVGSATDANHPLERSPVFELKPFAKATEDTLDAAVKAAQSGSIVIIGGGDTSYRKAAKRSLELPEGKELPGVAALSSK